MGSAAADADVILEAQGLTREVGSGAEARKIVNDVSYAFRSGQIYTILGPSGSGKSSFLRLLNRLDEPTSGTVMFHGQDACGTITPCQLRRRVGFLFQTPHLFPGSVRDNITYAAENPGVSQVEALAKQVRLDPALLDSDVEKLSGGEKQRIAMARLLATDPEVALLDEPTSALDPGRAAAIEQLILELSRERGLTVIVVSHSRRQAVRLGGEGLLIVDGCLAEHGPVEKLVSAPTTEAGRAFMQGGVH